MERASLLDCVQIDPPGTARSAVIWMHGLGADGHDFEPIVPELGIPDELGVRFVFPHAPVIPVTLNAGMHMRAWYDITELDLRRKHDLAGLRASTDAVEALVARERAGGIPSERIVLAGFSQGGAVALDLGLRYPDRLAGILALSTYLVAADTLEGERSEANRDTPILMAHGTYDPMVPLDRGQAARKQLEAWGHPVEMHTYPMQHQVCMEEIELVGAWLRQRLA